MSLLSDLKRKADNKKRNAALDWEETKQNIRQGAVDGKNAVQDREQELHISGKVLDNTKERQDEIEFSQKVSEAQMMLQNSGDRIIDSLQKAKNDYYYWESEDDSPMKRRQLNQIRKNEKMLLYRLGLVEEAKLDLENMTDAHRYEKAMKDLVYGYKMINSISANAGWTTKLALWFQRKKAKIKLDSTSASAMEAKMNANNTASDDEWESIDDYVDIEMEELNSMDANTLRKAAQSCAYFTAPPAKAGKIAADSALRSREIKEARDAYSTSRKNGGIPRENVPDYDNLAVDALEDIDIPEDMGREVSETDAETAKQKVAGWC